MKNYKLLTPGPLTTTESVKKEMLFDHCTWDDDYKKITLEIRTKLLNLAQVREEDYTVVLMQGSGTFGVESVLSSAVGTKEKLLILANGAYGARMVDIAKHAGIPFALYMAPYSEVPDAQIVAQYLKTDSSGILNDIESVGKVVKAAGKTLIVDAMSSFGGVNIPVGEIGIDFLISSANKCIQGVPGFSFIVCKRDALAECEGKARSLSLDLYDQWKVMEQDGKWRFTSPTHVVLAFAKALQEMEQEGGIEARSKRYYDNNRYLIQRMKKFGIQTYISGEHQGPIITTFLYPEKHTFSFEEMYTYIKERGYAIYPGKVTDADTFRIGNIGEIYLEDMEKLCDIFAEFFKTHC